MKEVILLAACSAGEVLPQSPDLPADVFTACLTTPIKVCTAPCSKLPRPESTNKSNGSHTGPSSSCAISSNLVCHCEMLLELALPCRAQVH